jgi:hypothetical protein
MSDGDSDSQHTFKRELSKLIRKHATGLQSSDFAEVLGEFHLDLAQGSLAPDVEVTQSGPSWELRVSYSTAISLEQSLDDYLDVGGICLQVDRDLPPLTDVTLTITSTRVDETVQLQARAVRDTPQGVAFQVTAPQASVAEEMRAMPDKIREAAEAQSREEVSEPAKQAASAPSTADPDAPLALDGQPEDTWQLAEHGLPEILTDLLSHQGLGVLDVEFDKRRAQIVLDGPKLVGVEVYPRAHNESLEKLLEAAGKLDDDQIARARKYTVRHGVSMAEALVDLDVLSYAEMGVALRTRSRFLLGLLWGARSGRAELYAIDELTRRLRVPSSSLGYHLFRRMRADFSERGSDWFEERANFFRAHRISRASQPGCDIEALELNKKEARLFEAVLVTPRPLSDVLRMAQLGEQATLVMLECLHRLGMLELEQINPFTRQRTRFVEQLQSMQARIQGDNSFDVLGLHWTAYQEEVDHAYESCLASLSDEELPDNLDEDALELVDQLRAQIDEAYEVLSSQKKRAAYRADIVDRFEKRNALQMFEDQADTAKLRRDLDSAIDACRRILEIDASHATARRDVEVLVKLRDAERG